MGKRIEAPRKAEQRARQQAIQRADVNAFKLNVTGSTANVMFDAIFNRDTSNPLDIFDLYGETFVNPAEEQVAGQIRARITTLTAEQSLLLSVKERERFGMIVPALAKAIISDDVEKIYEKDIDSAVRTAMDWFINPEFIDQTHIRIGMGGEQSVNSRIPAYITAAARTLDRVHTVFGQYGNWAIHNELLAKVGKERAAEVNAWIGRHIQEKIGEKGLADIFNRDFDKQKVAIRAKTKDKAGDDDELKTVYAVEEIRSQQPNKYLTIEDIRAVLVNAWKEHYRKEPDIKKLQKEYRFTDKLPQIVVFNAANAAISINNMDKNAVEETRERTQSLITAYVHEFYPHLDSSLMFQNDVYIPWKETEGNDYERLVVLYVHDLLAKVDGKLEQVDEKVEQYGAHHQKGQVETIMDMTPAELYGRLHPFFFQDRIKAADASERIPSPAIMAAVPSARHVIYHEGKPEIKFGVYRKLYAEHATTSGFIQWLEEKYAHAVLKQNQYGGKIVEEAQRIQREDPKANGPKKIDIRTYINKAINIVCAEIPLAKNTFVSFMKSSEFGKACAEQTYETALREFSTRIENEKVAHPVLDNQDSIAAAIGQLKRHREFIAAYKVAANAAIQQEDQRKHLRIARAAEGETVHYPLESTELVIKVGTVPVYYHQEVVDSNVWPGLEKPSFVQYEEQVQKAKGKEQRIKGTAGMTLKTLASIATSPIEEWDTMFSDWAVAFGNSAISEETMQQWVDSDVLLLDTVYKTIDEMELAKLPEGRITATLTQQVDSILQRHLPDIISATGLDEQATLAFFQKRYVPLVYAATERFNNDKLSKLKEDVNKYTYLAKDYMLLLSGIEPEILTTKDPVQRRALIANAEVRYTTLLESLFGSENGHQNGKIQDAAVIFVASPASSIESGLRV